MPEVSILLPSVRQDNAVKRIREFATTAADIDYEIVLVSPFSIHEERVRHIAEVEKRGVIRAMNEAYERSTGDLVVCWSDDAQPQPGALANILSFVKAESGDVLVGFRKKDREGRESEQWSVYGHLYVGWLCASRKTIDNAGGMFDPKFKNYWADPDLSLRAHERQIPVKVCPDAWLVIEQADDDVKQANLSDSFIRDTDVFYEKWNSHYGRGKKKEWWQINTPIPHSMPGRLRSIARKVPFLRSIKHSILERLRGHNE